MTSERISMQHTCVFMGMVLINTAVYSDFSEDHALYSERVEVPDIDLAIVVHYNLISQDDGSTRLNFSLNSTALHSSGRSITHALGVSTRRLTEE